MARPAFPYASNNMRGANMGAMSISHPDILDFITCKDQSDSCQHCGNRAPFSNFNISVKLTDEFMNMVDVEEEVFPLISPSTGEVKRRISPKKVFRLIAEMAWKNGEPGVIFIDRMNAENPTPGLGDFHATNPCSEQPLLPNEACNLGSINLVNHLKKDGFDWKKLKETVKLAVRFLDDVITVNKYPIPEIYEQVAKTRKIGLGVMGWADCLVKLGIPYASQRALDLAEQVMRTINETAYEASLDLADERGPFPAVKDSIYADHRRKPRNAARTTIAPTGTISRVFEVSSGIEPHFGLSYTKHIVDGPDLFFVNEDLMVELRRLRDTGEITEKQFYDAIKHVEMTGSVKDLGFLPHDIREVFAIALEIDPEWHIRMQAAFQKHTNNAVSKTVNLPESATIEDVENVYRMAYAMGCKGTTIYRNGSRNVQAMSVGTAPKDEPKPAPEPIPVRKRGSRLEGSTYRIMTGCGKIYVTLNYDENGLAEVFAQLGKAGGCASAQMQAIGKLSSIALRSGVDPKKIVDMLRGIRCSAVRFSEEGPVFSCADAIAQVINTELNAGAESDEGSVPEAHPVSKPNGIGPCPECGSPLVADSGCVLCPSCGYSRCG